MHRTQWVGPSRASVLRPEPAPKGGATAPEMTCSQPTDLMAATFAHDVFLSYARTPDAAVAREVDRVLESFHETVRQGGALGKEVLRPLRVCIDGSDFSLPPPDE